MLFLNHQRSHVDESSWGSMCVSAYTSFKFRTPETQKTPSIDLEQFRIGSGLPFLVVILHDSYLDRGIGF